MTDIPTPAMSEELDAVIELMQAKVSGAIFNGIKAFEHEPRRVLAILLAARQQLAEMRGAVDHIYRDSMLNEGGIISHEALSKCAAISMATALSASFSAAALAPTSQPERGLTFPDGAVERAVKRTMATHELKQPDCAQPERQASPALREAAKAEREHALTWLLHRKIWGCVHKSKPDCDCYSCKEFSRAIALLESPRGGRMKLTTERVEELREHVAALSIATGLRPTRDEVDMASALTRLLALEAALREAGPALEQCAKDSNGRAASFLFSNKESEYGKYLEKCAEQVRTLAALGGEK